MNYSEKLKDPRWQKKRLEIFQRDQWMCTICGDDKNTLHVHHLKYCGEPWDVDDSFIKTVCESCHTEEHFKPIPKPNNSEIKKREQVLIFESQLIDSKEFRAVKSHYYAILHWYESNGELGVLYQAKNDLSAYCFAMKIIFITISGDVYGEKETVIRHG